MSELSIDDLIGEPLASRLGVSGRPASDFSTSTGISIPSNEPIGTFRVVGVCRDGGEIRLTGGDE